MHFLFFFEYVAQKSIKSFRILKKYFFFHYFSIFESCVYQYFVIIEIKNGFLI